MTNMKQPIAPKRTRDPDSKLAALHDAALKLFTERGYENVSIANIAAEAGIAVGTVYRFYNNKLALLRSMLGSIENEFVEKMDEDWAHEGDFGERLDQVCIGLFALAEQRNTFLRLLSMTTDVVFEDGTLPGDRIQGQIRKMYQEGMASAAFRPGDIPFHAAMAHGLVEGAMMAWLRNDGPPQAEAARQLAAAMKHGFLSPVSVDKTD